MKNNPSVAAGLEGTTDTYFPIPLLLILDSLHPGLTLLLV